MLNIQTLMNASTIMEAANIFARTPRVRLNVSAALDSLNTLMASDVCKVGLIINIPGTIVHVSMAVTYTRKCDVMPYSTCIEFTDCQVVVAKINCQ